MALTQRLEFRQSQSLVMTPQLMQAIKLLQLSNLDLSAFVEEELERNPLLERASDGPEAPVAGEPRRRTRRVRRRAIDGSYGDEGGDASDSAQARRRRLRARPGGVAEPRSRHRAEIEQTLDTPLDNVFSEEPAEAAARVRAGCGPTAYTEWGGGASNDDDYNLEAFVAAEVTLGSHLAEQLAVAFSAPAQRMIGQYLIDLVDDAGYLPPDLGQAAERLGAVASGCRCGAVGAAEVRSARRLCPEFERVPRDPAPRTQPLRPRHAGAGGKSRSPGQARHRLVAQAVRRRRRRHHRHDR